MLAEFLGLKEQETGESLVEVAPSQAELADLYEGPEAFVFIQDGKQYLNDTKALASCPLIRNRILEANPDGATRMRQLSELLHFTNNTLHHAIHSPFKDNIKFSIAALGELFAANLSMTSLALNIPPYTHVRLGWYNDYIKQGGRIAMCLLAEGWCQSELNKIRSAYMGLNTVHFLIAS